MKKLIRIAPASLLLLAILLVSFFSVSTVFSVSTISSNIQSQGTIMYNDSIPLLGGWGGVRLYESTTHTNIADGGTRTAPASVVFPGEVASNAEMTMQYMKTHGWNAVRAYWEPPYRQQSPEWGYNSVWLENMIKIAETLGMYIIVDCHGYRDAAEYNAQWMTVWYGIISQFKDRYNKIIWEPLNEPLEPNLSGAAAVAALRSQYQAWITQARGLGDTHWIVVSAIEWGNSQPDMVDWFPVVTDPLDEIFYNWHYYYFYDDEPSHWTVAQAQAKADSYYDVVVRLIDRYHRPYLCTEMGAQSYYVSPPPDLQYDGASGYSTVTLAFMQRLVTRFDNYQSANQTRINYILWNAGDWSKDWGAGWHYTGLYGGMDVWGALLAYKSFW